MIRKAFSIFIVIAGLSLNGFSQEDDFLAGLIDDGLENNLQIKALKNEWLSKQAIILAAKTIPQPEFRFMNFGESIQTRTGPMQRKYSLKQSIPFPSKLSLKGKIAAKESEAAYARYILGVRAMIESLKSYFYDYYFVSRSINTLEAEKLILGNIRESIRSKYEVVRSSQQDLIKVDLEISEIDKKMFGLKKQKNLLKAQINIILDQPADRKINIPLGYKLKVKGFKASKEDLLKQALSESPHIAIDRLQLEKQQYKSSLAKQGYIPDFSIMAEYIEIGSGETTADNDGQNAWAVGAGIKIPLWFWKVNSEIKSENLKLESEKYKVKNKENLLTLKVEDLFFRLKTETQLMDLYDNVILPQALQNFSVSRIEYENGAIDFLNWLDAERNLISIKIADLKQAVDYKKSLARLEYIIGQDLE